MEYLGLLSGVVTAVGVTFFAVKGIRKLNSFNYVETKTNQNLAEPSVQAKINEFWLSHSHVKISNSTYKKLLKAYGRDKVTKSARDAVKTKRSSPTIDISVNLDRPKECPPKTGDFILAILMRPNDRDSMMGDLEERYYKWAEEFGHYKARRLYTLHKAWTVCALLWARFKKWGVVALAVNAYETIVEAIRKIVS